MNGPEFRFAVLGTILFGVNLTGEIPDTDKSASLELTSPKEHQVFQRASRESGMAMIEGDAAFIGNAQTTRILEIFA